MLEQRLNVQFSSKGPNRIRNVYSFTVSPVIYINFSCSVYWLVLCCQTNCDYCCEWEMVYLFVFLFAFIRWLIIFKYFYVYSLWSISSNCVSTFYRCYLILLLTCIYSLYSVYARFALYIVQLFFPILLLASHFTNIFLFDWEYNINTVENII